MILEREEGAEREREREEERDRDIGVREKNQSVASITPSTHPDRGSNLQPYGMMLQPTEPPG